MHPSEGLEIFKFQVRPPSSHATPGRRPQTRVSTAAGHAVLWTTKHDGTAAVELLRCEPVLRERTRLPNSPGVTFFAALLSPPLRRVCLLHRCSYLAHVGRGFPLNPPSPIDCRGLCFHRCSRFPTSNSTSKRLLEATPTGRLTPTLASPRLCRERAVACTATTPS